MGDSILTLSEGRRLCVRTAGADTEPLVIYLHGSPSSRLDVDSFDMPSQERGVRVAAFDRPGYGGSDPYPFTFESIARDAVTVAASLGADSFAIVGQSSGASYALAAAVHEPEHVTAVATAGGGTPFTPDTPAYSQLSPGERRAISLIGEDDVEAERLLAEADLPFIEALALDDDALALFWRGYFSPADRALLDTPYGSMIMSSIRESSRPGQIGWARDNLVRMGPWPFDLAALTQPVTLWYGDEDHHEAAAWLTARIPHAHVRIQPDRGHLLAFQDWGLILDDLSAHLR